MDSRWGKLRSYVGVVAAIGALLAGCGSSSKSSSSSSSSGSSAQRTQLMNQLSEGLKSDSSLQAPGLDTCISQKAQALPIGQLQALVKSASSPNLTPGIAEQVVVSCVSEGHGAAQLRGIIVTTIKNGFAPTLPAAFKTCVADRADQIPAPEVGQLIALASQHSSAGQAKIKQLGVTLGRQCLGQPSVLNKLRTTFLASIKQGLRSSSYSAAFRNCLLGKAAQISLAQLKATALNPTHSQATGEALGRTWAKQCIAAGAKP
jgi:hypothetical protein